MGGDFNQVDASCPDLWNELLVHAQVLYWQYKDEFGGRVQPTKQRVTPRAVSFAPPVGVIQPSSLVDEDAEAVKQKAREENSTRIRNFTPLKVLLEVQHSTEYYVLLII